jgi:hypothetical protein
MTSQATNRSEGVSKSCRGCSSKLHTSTEKELETAKAAQELLGAPTIGRGKCPAWGWWWGSQISLPRSQECTKMYNTFCPKIAKNDIFCLKVTKYTPMTFFKEYIIFKNFCYLRCFGVIPVQSFGSHIRPLLPGLGLRLIFETVQENFMKTKLSSA